MVEHPNNHLPNKQNNFGNRDSDEVDEPSDFDFNELDIDDTSYPESEEFESIDNQLDELNSALDDMERKNDNILAELTTLLKENREIRQQLQQCQQEDTSNEDGQHMESLCDKNK